MFTQGNAPVAAGAREGGNNVEPKFTEVGAENVAAATVRGKHREIARRYAWARRQRQRDGKEAPLPKGTLMAILRMGDIEDYLVSRYGWVLPDDDAGRDELFIAANHIAGMGGEVVKHVVAWAARWAPWTPTAEAEALGERVKAKPIRFKAATLAWRFGLTAAERKALGITTIRAMGDTDEAVKERRMQTDREWQASQRRAKAEAAGRPAGKNGRPPKHLKGQEPWTLAGMSRATWYRRNPQGGTEPTPDPGGETIPIGSSSFLSSMVTTVSVSEPAEVPEGHIQNGEVREERSEGPVPVIGLPLPRPSSWLCPSLAASPPAPSPEADLEDWLDHHSRLTAFLIEAGLSPSAAHVRAKDEIVEAIGWRKSVHFWTKFFTVLIRKREAA